MENEKITFTDVNTLGEFGLIKHITKDTELKHGSTILGIGDDAAVIASSPGMLSVVSSDMLVEGIHFDMIYSPLKHLGYKAVVVNVSDIYAMNATPRQITVSIAISNKYSVEAMEQLYEGINLACEKYNVDLVGGDMTSSPKGMIIGITVIGEAPKEKIVSRSGANVGDIICTTGQLGGAYLGLQILEREKQLYLDDNSVKPDLEDQKYVLGKQLKPEARKDMIELFEQREFLPSSMIDISDGLASELFHICESSGVGAYLEEGKIPINQESELLALKFKLDPVTCALNGGEDYELLFTVKPEDLEKIRLMPSTYIIGEIVDKKDGVKLHTTGGNIHDLQAQGWNHFSTGSK